MQTTVTDWRGFEQVNFTVDGRESFFIRPKTAAEGNPWVWRTEFFGAFDFPDWILLQNGWHIGYTCCTDMYGCPKSVEYFEQFYRIMTEEFGLSEKPSLFGFSRGALYAVSYALAYPAHCSSLYLDAPVLRLWSWPGGFGKGKGSDWCWNQVMEIYGYHDTDKFLAEFRDNPIDRAEDLVKTGLPVMIVYGDSDGVVPSDENAVPFYNKFRAAGGDIRMIGKRNCDHHPHSLGDPTPIVTFVQNAFDKIR